jgi:hypothetical protein
MRRNWIGAVLPALLVLGLSAGATVSEARATKVATPAAARSAKAPRSKNALHQFTGVVTAMDKASLTVEKDGKQPQTRTFVRDEQTLTSGDVARDARVTVFYRDENGRAVAHRVVVKAAPEPATR